MCHMFCSNQHIIHIQQQICRIIIILLELDTTIILTLGVVNLDHERVKLFVPLLGRLLKCIERFLKKTILFSCSSWMYPSGCFMYILSSNSLWRNIVLTSNCSNSRSNWATIANNIQINVCLTTRENISLYSIPSFWAYPLATNIVLYCSLSFLWKTNLQPITLESFGRSTNSHVWFLSKGSISCSMTVIHLSLSYVSIASLSLLILYFCY